MRNIGQLVVGTALAILATVEVSRGAGQTLTGQAAFGDWHQDQPGVRRHITAGDLAQPYASTSASHAVAVADAPAGALPKVPAGFAVRLFASGFDNPRVIRVAPNGDVFVAETAAGNVRVLRAPDGAAKADGNTVFASGLDQPFGIAFYPPGGDPKWVYVANTNSVVRFAYRSGDTAASGPAEIVVPQIATSTGGHTTRDIAFSPDGKHMYVSVGSASNVAERMPKLATDKVRAWQEQRGLGAAWASEEGRADVLVFDPGGKNGKVFATGIRNCAGLTVQPLTGTVWCATNERDGLGDNLPPDYATRVQEDAFYGWPWYYIGDHEDPRHKAERPDLAGHVTTPDVLIQPHSAPLQIAFYTPSAGAAAAFPKEYAGDAFVTLHGSWNRAKRTGYKVVRVVLKDGQPTGEYEDFLTGFVIDEDSVWGRPVGVAVAHDGALLVGEDGNGTIWRVAPSGG